MEIEATLTERGLIETLPGTAETVVVAHVATSAKRSREAFYEGWGGWGWRSGTGATESYEAGALVVDVFDARTKRLLWSGFAGHALPATPASDAHVVHNTVRRIFKAFSVTAEPAISRSAQDATVPADRMVHVIFSPSPAVLVRVDGEPTYDDVDGTPLERIVNTSALILRDASGMHYLRFGESWLEAYELTGSWSAAGTAPEGGNIALERATSDRRTDLFITSRAHRSRPVVYVSTMPAELIVTDGEPEYVPFEGTSLLYVRNTTAWVFREPTDQELYVRVSRGWYRAWTTDGPWEPIAEGDLPADLTPMRGLTAAAPPSNRPF